MSSQRAPGGLPPLVSQVERVRRAKRLMGPDERLDTIEEALEINARTQEEFNRKVLDSFGSGALPQKHAATHEPGGSDQINFDLIADNGSRLLGWLGVMGWGR